MATDCPQPGFDCHLDSDGGAGECVGLACVSDTDCAAAMRCDIGIKGCMTAADGGSSCSGWCAPQWQVPCVTAEDCGPGFTCGGGGGLSYTGPYACGATPTPIPPYATRTTVPCSRLVPPNLPAGLMMELTGTADGGGDCCPIQVTFCVAETTPPCAVDSDCPPTWTCQCATCDAAFDAACTKQCVAPNADLENPVCDFPPPPPPRPSLDAGPSTSPGLADGRADSGSARPKALQESEGSPGGCQIGEAETIAGWPLGVVALFAWASRHRARRGRRPTR